jgi:hypothetical protein
MKAFIKSGCLGLLAVLWPIASRGELSPPKTLLGKFMVSSVNGSATCVSEGRVFELKKGDTITARGSSVETDGKSNVILVFSNGTGVYVDGGTRFDVLKFDQEFFAPNNNLRVEPSNSNTLVRVKTGRVVVSTPRLLSGTTMVYETMHAAVGIRGDKLLLEADDKQTHVAMISGQSTVNPRNGDGQFVSIGKRLVTGQEAFIKYTAGGGNPESTEPASDNAAPAPAASDGSAPVAAATTPANTPPPAPVWETAETEATVVQLVGAAEAKLPGGRPATALAAGDKLPRGTVITTDVAGEVCLQFFPGALATVQPSSAVELAGLSLTTNRGTVTRQSTLLSLRSGTVVSLIDPASGGVNEFAVRTPQGTATAQGTSFVASVGAGGFSVATTADTVTFVTPGGTRYAITAGQVSVALPGGEPQPPIPLAAAVAGNPQIGAAVRAAFAVAAQAVERNLGGLSAASATNLLAKVAGAASAALPDEAAAFATRAIGAASAPSSATSQQTGAAIGAITQAIVSAAPGDAAAIAVAALRAAQAHDTTVGAAAAKASPSQAAIIAAAVSRALFNADHEGATPAHVQAMAAIAAAITASSPSQAAPVAAATMQVIVATSATIAPGQLAQHAGLLAASITAAAPQQAIPVASALMKLLVLQLTEATPQIVAQVGAMLAGPIISVVPGQAQEVATAVMQIMAQVLPNITPAWMAETAGLFTATLVQLLPAQAGAIVAGVSSASGLSVADLEQSLARYAGIAAGWVTQIQGVTQLAAAAAQRGAAGSALLFAGSGMVRPMGAAGGSLGGAFGGPTGGLGGTSITIGDRADSSHSTSIVITQFDPGLINQLTADIEAAQAAQTSVQFSVDTTPGRGNTVRPEPVVPGTLPSEFVVSPAR